jgi:hypothetical protein
MTYRRQLLAGGERKVGAHHDTIDLPFAEEVEIRSAANPGRTTILQRMPRSLAPCGRERRHTEQGRACGAT